MFLERIAALISSRGITRNKLLHDLGLDKSSFSNWEKRGTIPSGDVVAKIADYFGVTTDYLLGRTDQKETPTSGDGDGLNDMERELITLYRELNQEGQDLLLDTADTMVSSGKYIKSDQNQLGKEHDA